MGDLLMAIFGIEYLSDQHGKQTYLQRLDFSKEWRGKYKNIDSIGPIDYEVNLIQTDTRRVRHTTFFESALNVPHNFMLSTTHSSPPVYFLVLYTLSLASKKLKDDIENWRAWVIRLTKTNQDYDVLHSETLYTKSSVWSVSLSELKFYTNREQLF